MPVAQPSLDPLGDHQRGAGWRDGRRDRADPRVRAEPERRDRLGSRLPCVTVKRTYVTSNAV
jgi:hypothetical protein